jgi:hypothetical protein
MSRIAISCSLLLSAACWADAADQSLASTDAVVPGPGGGGPSSDVLSIWKANTASAQSSQPHWMEPLAMGTGLLQQQFTYDQVEEHQLNGGGYSSRFDGGRGLEIIPTATNEVIVDMPDYAVRHVKKPREGFDDWTFLAVKQRLLSADEAHGDYVVTAQVAATAPSGAVAFSNHAWVFTPTLEAGKGWGDADIQVTVGMPIPASREDDLGLSLVTNAILQYHVLALLWPEIEYNTTHWFDGQRGGKTEAFVTPALMVGPVPLLDGGLHMIVGAGYQYAVAPQASTKPVTTPAYPHAWIFSARLAF